MSSRRSTPSPRSSTSSSSAQTVIVKNAAAAASADSTKGAYSSWKREPTTAEVLFGLDLPYRAPRSLLGAFLWRRRVWLETTFALSMMESWEKLLIMIVIYGLLTLVLTAAYFYLPHHLAFVRQRAMYYLLGRDVAQSVDGAGVEGIIDGVGKWVARWGSAGAEL